MTCTKQLQMIEKNYLKLFPRGVMKDNAHFIKYKHISKLNSHQLYDDHDKQNNSMNLKSFNDYF